MHTACGKRSCQREDRCAERWRQTGQETGEISEVGQAYLKGNLVNVRR